MVCPLSYESPDISLCAIGLTPRMLTDWREAGMTPGKWTPKLFYHREQSLSGDIRRQRPKECG